MNGASMPLRIVVALALGLAVSACNKSDSGGSASSGGSGSGGSGAAAASGAEAGGPQVSGMQREAEDAAVAELMKHWTKGPDGWTSALAYGSAYAPEYYLRQFRDLTVESVEPSELDDSDKMNGIEWAGEVLFKKSPCREAGVNGVLLDGNVGLMYRNPGRWTQWVDFQASALKVQKVKGQWQVNTDTMLLRGRPPTPDDYAKAGVKGG